MKPDEELECRKNNFGKAWPEPKDKCKYCGRPFIEHADGHACPVENEDIGVTI